MIPSFDNRHLLPPFTGSTVTQLAGRSPYSTTVGEIGASLALTNDRKALLWGLLQFRADLRSLGFTDGFQWVDGSFVENIEASSGRPPNDIDIISFLNRPAQYSNNQSWAVFLSSTPTFNNKHVKTAYKCDTYFADLSLPPKNVVDNAAYWLSLFSHQRGTQHWKGILSIQIDTPVEDAQMLAYLRSVGVP